MADYGIAIKKASYNGSPVNKNVDQCADYELAYSSKFAVPKQFDFNQGIITVTSANTSSNPATVTITHNLGYVPIFYATIEGNPGDGSRNPIDGAAGATNFTAYATTTNLVIQSALDAPSGGNIGNYAYAYYIFYDDTGTSYG